MKACPFCLAEVPDEARKCMHCGEWVVTPPARENRPSDEGERRQLDELGRAANRYVDHENTKAWVGGIVAVLFVLFVFIPFACSANERMNPQVPSFPTNGFPR